MNRQTDKQTDAHRMMAKIALCSVMWVMTMSITAMKMNIATYDQCFIHSKFGMITHFIQTIVRSENC